MEPVYLYLKFGKIQGGNFDYSPEALELYNSLGEDESSPEYKRIACEVIDNFNGNIFLWWENREVGAEQAKAYLLNYKGPWDEVGE